MTDWAEEPLGIWTCKIGEAGVNPAAGLDAPMRKAVESAYREITGRESDFIFSGWRGELTEPERAVVGNREPRPEVALISSPDGDWIGLYKDGKLVDEGHSLSEQMVLKAVGIVPLVIEGTDEQFDSWGGRCPEDFPT